MSYGSLGPRSVRGGVGGGDGLGVGVSCWLHPMCALVLTCDSFSRQGEGNGGKSCKFCSRTDNLLLKWVCRQRSISVGPSGQTPSDPDKIEVCDGGREVMGEINGAVYRIQETLLKGGRIRISAWRTSHDKGCKRLLTAF